MQLTLDLVVIIQLITVIVVIAGFLWRLPTKGDIQRLDDRIDKMEIRLGQRIDKVEAKIDDTRESLSAELDTKIDDLRKETKADMQRLEDRLGAANQYHARSVELLDAIRKELEERRQLL